MYRMVITLHSFRCCTLFKRFMDDLWMCQGKSGQGHHANKICLRSRAVITLPRGTSDQGAVTFSPISDHRHLIRFRSGTRPKRERRRKPEPDMMRPETVAGNHQHKHSRQMSVEAFVISIPMGCMDRSAVADADPFSQSWKRSATNQPVGKRSEWMQDTAQGNKSVIAKPSVEFVCAVAD